MPTGAEQPAPERGHRPQATPDRRVAPAPTSSAVPGDRDPVLSTGNARLVPWRAGGAALVPAVPSSAPDATAVLDPAEPARGVVSQVVGAMPPVPDWPGIPSLDESAFPTLALVLLGLFVVITGRGDRRDPKLVRADLDARGHEVGFS